MKASRKITFKLLLLRLLLLVAPTVGIMYLVIGKINEHYTLLHNGYVQQSLVFALGTVVSYLLYVYRVRFSVTFAIVLLLLYSNYKLIAHLPGEFDVFYATIRFWLFAVLFTFSWLVGFGLARLRFFPIFFAIVLIGTEIVLKSTSLSQFRGIGLNEQFDVSFVFKTFVGLIAYVFYMMYTAEALRDVSGVNWRKAGSLISRLVAFIILIGMLFYLAVWLNRSNVGQSAQEIAAAGGAQDSTHSKQDPNSMLNKNKDNSFDLKNYTELKNRLGQSNELMFCSHLNNFFPTRDSTPNPLYFVCFYLTRYDQQKERFERDSLMPFKDEFCPDVSRIPLFHTKTDSSVLKRSMKDKFKHVTTADVYVNQLSLNSFVAPATAFSCQPITVEGDFKDVFKAAYKAKSFVSELNSAYFVYNTKSPALKQFQEMRIAELNKVKNYKEMDKTFYDYYTGMPKGPTYDSIADLAKQIGKKALTPVEKVLAVRDYFLSKDDNGDPLYVYTLTPGKPEDPNIPNASMLHNFLFRTHKGYCTYFAGATQFLLRSLGVPTRMTVGFMTVDRADKNKGWYWFYANQAHAWVQVYFPGYGWLDFDTTIGNEDSRQSPSPDGTPPLQPPKAWLAVNGYVPENPDTIKKTVDVTYKQMVFHEKEYELSNPVTMQVDAAHCAITMGDKKCTITSIHKGDSILVVAYDDQTKAVPHPRPGLSIAQQVEQFPKPVIADEIQIKPKFEKPKEEKKEKPEVKKSMSLKQGITLVLSLLLLFLLLFFSFPLLCAGWLKMKADKNNPPREKAYHVYRYALFIFNQMGHIRGRETPLEFAREQVDKVYGTDFVSFMNTYLKLKYANLPADAMDEERIRNFYSSFRKKVSSHYKASVRFARFLNVPLAFRFWARTEKD